MATLQQMLLSEKAKFGKLYCTSRKKPTQHLRFTFQGHKSTADGEYA
jgi:hypothetical protein